MRLVVSACLFVSMLALAGCVEWTQDSQGNLQSVGLPGVPVWQSNEPPPQATPSSLGFTPEESAQISGPVLVTPSANGSYHYRFYQTGQNHCAEDLQKMLAQREAINATGPAPYCTDHAPMPTAAKHGSFFAF